MANVIYRSDLEGMKESPVQILTQYQSRCQEEEDSGDNFGNHAIVHDCRIPVRSGGFRSSGFNGEGRHGIRYKGFCQLFPVGFLFFVYDDGEKKTWKELFKKFAVEKDVEPGRIGIIGATPLEFGGLYEEDFLKKYFAEKGFSKVVCYGMGDGLDAVREAAAAEKNIVVSSAGIAAAKYLQQKFGTPYELFCPPEIIPEWKEKKRAGSRTVECRRII